ncbi:MAG: NLI interacting domain protein [Coxiella sp. (in: Bacteria)]|nr:MAG: NLI interacting domain protein [Coxiella sp. (in: g-proteobacteria)]
MKLLILDLDETLIYASKVPLPEKVPAFEAGPYTVYLRPHLNELLLYCQANFEVAVWTVSTDAYAERIVECAFPVGYPLSFVWARNKCTPSYRSQTGELNYQKKLRKLRKKYRLEDVIVIDDSPENHLDNYGNLIAVKPYVGDDQDDELHYLIRYLDTIKSERNIRTIEKRNWKRRLFNQA